MKNIFRNKKLLMVTCIFLVMVIAGVGFWHSRSVVSVEASGVVSIDISQGSSYAPGAEMASDRTENGKKYYLAKDSYALDVSMGAIHYKDNYSDKNEQWKDIDLNFENGRITKAPYVLTVNQDDKSFTVQDKKTGQTTSLKLTRIGAIDISNVAKKAPTISAGKIQWDNVVTDLDLAISAENTRVSFDWIVKSANAPHEMEFEILDAGIPLSYKGVDADGNTIEVAATKVGNKVTERIASGGKYPKVINPTLNFQVGSSANDCYVYRDVYSEWNMAVDEVTVRVGYYSYEYSMMGNGLRFTNVTIPTGSTITSAYITIRSMATKTYTTVNSYIIGNKENVPADWTSFYDYQIRRGTSVGGADNTKRTSARVAWDNIGSWTSGSDYNSPEIKTVIQELINAHAPNNQPLALFWDDHDGRSTSSTGRDRMGRSYDSSSTYAPKLHIEYTSGTPNISNTPSSYNFGTVDPNATLSTGLNYFSVTNNSASAVNITIGGTDITGGTTWTLSDTATPGAAIFGMKAGLNGGSYNVIVKKNSPFNTLKSNLAASASQGWGLQLLAPTNYTDSVQKAGTVTLTATTS